MTLHSVESSIRYTAIPLMMTHAGVAAGGLAGSDDPTFAPLVRSLLPPGDADEVLRGLYTTAFHAKLMEHLDRLRTATAIAERGGTALQPWRLKRVTSFIDDNIDQSLQLDCLARAAGLSRMHFAALFRKTTGMRPHDYVVRRRIELAQKLLSASSTPIVEIALSVGFQSQSHFTTVFKRLLGITPHRWRQMTLAEDIAA